MYKAGVLPDFEENGNHAEIPQLQDDNEVYEEYYDDVPSWEEDDDEDFEVQRSPVFFLSVGLLTIWKLDSTSFPVPPLSVVELFADHVQTKPLAPPTNIIQTVAATGPPPFG
jgi:hypothetical protein